MFNLIKIKNNFKTIFVNSSRINSKEKNNSFLKLTIEGITSLERGLKIIDIKLNLGPITLDLLGIDPLGRLVIIEWLENEDDTILLKAIDDFDWIFRHMKHLQQKYQNWDMDISLSPRVIIVAPGFSSTFLSRMSYLTNIEIQLYRYGWIDNNESSGKKLIFEMVSYSSKKRFTKDIEEKTIDELINYIQLPPIKSLCLKAVEELQRMTPKVTISTDKGYISFKIKGEEFAGIYPRKEFFWLNISHNSFWQGVKIEDQQGLQEKIEDVKRQYK